MIKVGDKFLDYDNNIFIVRQVKNGRVLLCQESNGMFINMSSEHLVHARYRRFVDYDEYEQQKQRADAADTKWERLKQGVKQLDKNIVKSHYESYHVTEELFEIIENLERGEE